MYSIIMKSGDSITLQNIPSGKYRVSVLYDDTTAVSITGSVVVINDENNYGIVVINLSSSELESQSQIG